MIDLDQLPPPIAETIRQIRADYPSILRPTHVREILNVSAPTLRRIIDEGALTPSYALRDGRFFLEEVLEYLVDNLAPREEPAEETPSAEPNKSRR